jgi:ribosomal protein S18 acetylase RimI-like enzyme
VDALGPITGKRFPSTAREWQWTWPSPHGAVEVAYARVEEAGALVALHRSVLSERDWFITEPHEFTGSIEDKVRLIRDLRRSANGVFLVAHREGKVVGFLTIQGGVLQRMRHVGRLEIMVDSATRGQGVGVALMSSVIDWAEHNPIVTKLALSVFASNERAIGLYRRFGFEVEGHRVREYRMEDGSYRDDLLMYRWVDPK